MNGVVGNVYEVAGFLGSEKSFSHDISRGISGVLFKLVAPDIEFEDFKNSPHNRPKWGHCTLKLADKLTKTHFDIVDDRNIILGIFVPQKSDKTRLRVVLQERLAFSRARVMFIP